MQDGEICVRRPTPPAFSTSCTRSGRVAGVVPATSHWCITLSKCYPRPVSKFRRRGDRVEILAVQFSGDPTLRKKLHPQYPATVHALTTRTQLLTMCAYCLVDSGAERLIRLGSRSSLWASRAASIQSSTDFRKRLR